jgi:O-acetylhomoserine/O-acetylserine sulfhydrylase
MIFKKFKHYGIGSRWVTEETPEAFAAAIDEKTKAFFVDSIAILKYVVSHIPAIARYFFFFRFCDPDLN